MARRNTTTTTVSFPNEFFATEQEYKEFLAKPAQVPARSMEDEYGPRVEVQTVASAIGYGDTDFTREMMRKYNTSYKSVIIRALNEEGMKPGLIAKKMGIRPQHVHNTINQVYKGAR